jgi:hypothetical protein
MQPGFIEKAVRRANRNVFLISLVVILILAGVAAVSYKPLLGLLLGPLPLTSQQIAKISDIDSQPRTFVTVTGNIEDSGIKMVSGNAVRGSPAEAYYGQLAVGKKLLLIKTKDNQFGDSYTGYLIAPPTFERVNIIESQDSADAGQDFLPYMLDTTSDIQTNTVIGVLIGTVILIIALRALILAILRSSSTGMHPFVRRLKRFGDVNTVRSEINAEAEVPTQSLGTLRLTPHWVLNAPNGGFNALRLEDVVWLYRKVTTTRVNFVPVSKRHSAELFDRYGKSMTIMGSEKFVNEVLQAVYRQAPWAVVGYGKDLAKMWRSKRADMIAAVDQKRITMQNKTDR